MKVECPICNHKWNEELHATICPYKVALTQSAKINEIFNHITKKTERGIFAQQIFDLIQELEGKEISVKLISNRLGVSKYTDGDLIRTILDYHVCKGMLTKTKYKKGRGGHRWIFASIFKSEGIECQYYDSIKNLCSNKNWKIVGEGEEIT